MSELTIMPITDLAIGGNEVAVDVEPGFFKLLSKGTAFKSEAPTFVMVNDVTGIRLRCSAKSMFNASKKIPNCTFCFERDGQVVINVGISFWFEAKNWKYFVRMAAPTAVTKKLEKKTAEATNEAITLADAAFKDKYKMTKVEYLALPE